MEERTLALYTFIQERYLWQFYSRTWDREENIKGILEKYAEILGGKEVPSSDSLKDRAYFAEAKTAARETQQRFPWLKEMGQAQIESMVKEIEEKMIDVYITRSLNLELTNPNY